MRLWVKAIPRHVRFHDLRHTTATLLLKSGAPLATVQKIVRHTDPALTSEIYGHLDVEDMRAGINRLHFGSDDWFSQPAGSALVDSTAIEIAFVDAKKRSASCAGGAESSAPKN
jgi:hypothetical protein